LRTARPYDEGASLAKWLLLRLALGKLTNLLLKRSLKLGDLFELVRVIVSVFYSITAI